MTSRIWLGSVLGLALFVLIALLVGGPHSATDTAVSQALVAWRDGHPFAGSAAIALTWAGAAVVTVPLAALGALYLFRARGWRDTLTFLLCTLGARLAVEVIKLAAARPRPHFEPFPVPVTSLSFPSGHAANSMATFLSIALLVAPARWRHWSVPLAVALSIAVGATRPLLGVHWTSDVIAGWSLGAAWVLAWSRLLRSERSEA